MVQDEGSSSVTSSSPLQCFSLMSVSPGALRELKSDERGLYLIHLLLNCANHVAAGSLEHANAFLEYSSLLASTDGDTIQRLAAYFTEALACRVLRSWPGLYRALHSATRAPPAAEAAAARRHFSDLLPFIRVSSLVSSQAIAEAMEGERMIHVVDLHADDACRWLGLLQFLSTRRDGPPHLRITGVHDQKDVLAAAAARLSEEAEKLDIPFQFNAVVSRIDRLNVESLRVKTGEALAVCSVLQLHTLLAAEEVAPPLHQLGRKQGILGELLEKDPNPDSASSSPPPSGMGRFLASIWRLSPKIVVVTEQEASHNGVGLMERFMEALNYYAAMFDCMESTAGGRSAAERGRVERLVFGEEIKNIIACEGLERRERHERLERWGRRMEAVGFGRVALSYHGLLQGRRMLQSFCFGEGYKIREENGCFVICWQDRALFSVSAWSCRRFD